MLFVTRLFANRTRPERVDVSMLRHMANCQGSELLKRTAKAYVHRPRNHAYASVAATTRFATPR